MKTTTFVIGIIIALIIGTGAGYSLGKGTGNDSGENKELQDSITMMKEQSATIKKMAEIMTTSGLMMQTIGATYKDDMVVSKGKDLEMMGEKYVGENTKASESNGTMKNMMEN